MKIWIYNHYAISPQYPGGTRHYDLSKYLVTKGHDVSIFASSFLYNKLEETKDYPSKPYLEEDIDGVRFNWFKTFPYKGNSWRRVVNMLSYCRQSYKYSISSAEKPDIIVGSSVHLFAVLTAYFIAKRKKVPFVMEVRDLWPKTLIDMGVNKLHPLILLFSWIERFTYKKALRIITLLPKSGEYIASLGIDKSKIKWVPNGINLGLYQGVLDKAGIKQRKFMLAYTGQVGMANDLITVLEAAKQLQEKKLDDVEFVIVGDGPEKSKLKDFKEQNKLKNVRLLAPVPKSEVRKILNEADGLIFNLEDSPVFNYGISSNKLFDYLSSGKPIIFACNASNNPVKEANAGLSIPAKNPSAYVKAVEDLISMSLNDRDKLGANGVKFVEEHHDTEKIGAKLESILKEVVDEL